MGGGNTIVPLKATGVSFLVSDDRIPSCYTTSFSSTATMAVVHVASRRLSRIEVCSLYTETRVYAQLTCALLYVHSRARDTRKIQKKVDGSQFTRSLALMGVAGKRDGMHCILPSLFQTEKSNRCEKFNGDTCN